jgi:hypothetical protein
MVTNFDDADATDFEALRQRYKGVVERAGAKLTPTAMLLKVVAAALRRFPDFNASIDVATQEIVYKRYVNLGVAVDTDHGLLVPVVKGADRKSVVELSVELAQLAEKARARKLTPDDMSGGNFTVSNLGGIGGTGFSPDRQPARGRDPGRLEERHEARVGLGARRVRAAPADAAGADVRSSPHRWRVGGSLPALGLPSGRGAVPVDARRLSSAWPGRGRRS